MEFKILSEALLGSWRFVVANRRETEQQLDRLKSSREALIREAIQQLRNVSTSYEYSPPSSDDGDFGSKVAVYFDRERKQPVAKVMIYPRGSQGNFCIIFDANIDIIDWRFTEDSWIQDF